MKFRIAYNFYSGILFAIVMEYIHPVYMFLKSISIPKSEFSFFYQFLFYFNIGWFTPILVGLYYIVQIEMNKLFSKFFIEETK